MLKTEYPTVNGNNFALRNVYNDLGYLKEIRRYTSSDDGKANGALQGRRYWQADNYNIDGRVDGETYGNGLANDRVYSPATGRLISSSIDRAVVTSAPYLVQDMHYGYDLVGNVETRADRAVGRGESFEYDGLDRLTRHTMVTGIGGDIHVTFDQKGNILTKDDVGTYGYDATKKHALIQVSGGPIGTQTFNYDANGNMTDGYGRTITWTSFNQVASVVKGSYSSAFSFGAAHERVKQVSHLETTIYIGGIFEQVTPVGGSPVTEYRHYIMAPTGRVAVYTDRSNYQRDVKYYHTDGLGSITSVTNDTGAIYASFAFDAWGKRIDPTSGSTITSAARKGISHGYTDHEQLDDLGLIHMNGRIYDPVLGRFISADPNVDGVHDAQGFNRYSYVGNNPMNRTDPTGYFKGGGVIVAIVAVIVAAVVTVCTAGAGAAAFASFGSFFSALGSTLSAAAAFNGAAMLAVGVGGFAGGFVSGFAGSLLNGGNVGDAFKSGVVGGVWGAVGAVAAAGIGGMFDKFAGALGEAGTWSGRALAHGLANGAISEAESGNFRSGFYAGAFASAASPLIHGLGGDALDWHIAERTALAAVIGGTAAQLGGGKFANGAVTGAFVHLFNDEAKTAATRRYVVGIYSNVAAKDGAKLTDGHAAITVYDRVTGTSTIYGLWPDSHPDIKARGMDNGSGSDIRKDFVRDMDLNYKYQHWQEITDAQYGALMKVISANETWHSWDNCAAFASHAFAAATGVSLGASVGVTTPRALGDAIYRLNGNANNNLISPTRATEAKQGSSSF